MRYPIELRAGSAFAISRSKATGNELATVRYVPGASWRGALAAEMIRRNGLGARAHEDPEFRALFLENRVRFGDLRMEGEAPWPLSARVCAEASAEHRILDILLAPALGRTLPRECGERLPWGACGAKLNPPAGFYHRPEGRIEPLEILARLNAHSAISIHSLRIRPGQFFSTEVVEKDQDFAGVLIAPDDLDPVLRKWFPEDGAFLAIGRGATRGQGHAEVKIGQPRDDGDLAERLERLNGLFQGSGLVCFTCTCTSATVVYDPWLMSRPYLYASDIADAAGIDRSELKDYVLKNWFSRLAPISGWNVQAGLPRPDCHAIIPGAAFLFARPVAEEERAREVQRLAGILRAAGDGIGERWEQGFGEAVFCDPFHYEQVTP